MDRYGLELVCIKTANNQAPYFCPILQHYFWREGHKVPSYLCSSETKQEPQPNLNQETNTNADLNVKSGFFVVKGGQLWVFVRMFEIQGSPVPSPSRKKIMVDPWSFHWPPQTATTRPLCFAHSRVKKSGLPFDSRGNFVTFIKTEHDLISCISDMLARNQIQWPSFGYFIHLLTQLRKVIGAYLPVYM